MVKESDVISQNLWWKFKEWYLYDKDVAEYDNMPVKFERKEIEFKKGKIYIILGPRRIGKTSWMKLNIRKLISRDINPRNILYFDCEAIPSKSRESLRKVIKKILDMAGKENYIFLDEITRILDWQTELKYLYDSGVLSDSAVIITGSLPPVIKNGAEFMPGRGVEGNEYFMKQITFRDFILSLPFSYLCKISKIDGTESKAQILQNLIPILKDTSITLEESMKDNKKIFDNIYPYIDELRKLFDFYILTGGFPKVINNYFRNNNNAIENTLYEEILNYVLGDVTKVNKRDETAKQILVSVSRRIGSRYSYNALSRDIEEGIEHQTLISYVDVLESSFVLQSISSYDSEKNTEMLKGNKKIYFSDPFILYGLEAKTSGKSGFEKSAEYMENEENKGKIVEGIAANHLSKIKEIPKMKEAKTFLWFYYDKNKEIDFVYKRENDTLIGIEAKYQHNVKINEIKKIEKIKDYLILSYDAYDVSNDVIVIPASMFLSLLKKSEKNL